MIKTPSANILSLPSRDNINGIHGSGAFELFDDQMRVSGERR